LAGAQRPQSSLCAREALHYQKVAQVMGWRSLRISRRDQRSLRSATGPSLTSLWPLASLRARSSRLARRTRVRGFRLAIGSHRSTTALLRAAFAPLPLPNSQTEAQIIRTFRHLALMGGSSRSPACPICAHRRAYAAGPPSRPQRDEVRGRLYGGFGKFKDSTGRGFRSSCDLSDNAKALASMFSSRTPVAALPRKQQQ
jgi:hypothetical protein